VSQQLFEEKTTEEIENIMDEILPDKQTLDPDRYLKMTSLHYLHFLVVKVIRIGWDQELPIFLPS
jgi:pyridoxine 5'-phosphate synthase PdxJ